MSVVTLVSGGLDSSLVALLAKEEGLEQFPLFVDYGQRAKVRELDACRAVMRRMGLPEPAVAELGGFGALIRSGLTDASLHVVDDAFTPGRNMLFLLVASAHAFQRGADAVSIGLLHEDASIFPDQTSAFLADAEAMIRRCMGREIRVLAPLAGFHKVDVVALAQEKGVVGTYSCHLGLEDACGACIACNEFRFGDA
ncbi:7-cyano-7-deazaguanine synthase [Sphingomonas sanguinis]|uniref:7-cyano-7-deazaguanine synthase n=1 Tax=Sphingomonas sanguinis TaxID=33051 RepID=A0A147JCJ6_9SPHN|nr:7-cyano-7-deazaguanine synthase [Sphingomonas sanguinis]KTW17286.1 ExsB family transcriptional regulator [Sphingomonas sanguinis]